MATVKICKSILQPPPGKPSIFSAKKVKIQISEKIANFFKHSPDANSTTLCRLLLSCIENLADETCHKLLLNSVETDGTKWSATLLALGAHVPKIGMQSTGTAFVFNSKTKSIRNNVLNHVVPKNSETRLELTNGNLPILTFLQCFNIITIHFVLYSKTILFDFLIQNEFATFGSNVLYQADSTSARC